jgi:SAM-dependent methyltransferase
MRQITCPVCKTDPVSTLKTQSLYICNRCATRWTFLPEEVDAAALYTDEVYAVVDNRKSVFERIIFAEARKVLQKARKINPSATSLLDFGSGKGQFLTVADTLGWRGTGVETATERADFARKNYHVEVLNEYYQGGKIQDGNFDFITLNHVLEHLPEPLALVSELLNHNLAAGGLAYIEVPRADSWQAKIAGENWIHWDIPKHLTHWTESGMEDQFEKIGFSKVASRSLSVHLGVLGMLQALLSLLGYRKNLILQLKQKKSFSLLLLIAFILPVAGLLELFSCGFGKSGIFGIYLKKNG